MPKPRRAGKIRASLKKHFIPHEGNDYHPHILHAKRTVFYAAFLILIKVFVIAYAVVIPIEAFTAPDVLAAQGSRILALTNDLRKQQGLPALARVAILDRSAGARAADMAANGYFSHVSPAGRTLATFLGNVGYRYSTAGENLAMGFSDASEVINAWIQSPTHYANLVDHEFTETGIGVDEGLYDGAQTVFVAEHFGLPQSAGEQPAPNGSSGAGGQAGTQAKPVGIGANGQTKIAIASEPKPTAAAPSKPTPVVQPSNVIKPTPILPSPTVPSQPPAPTQPPSKEIPSPSGPQPTALSPQPTEATSTSAVAANSLNATGTAFAALAPPSYDRANSSIDWLDTGDGKTQIIVHAAIAGNVAVASALVQGYPVDLAPDKTTPGVYTGTLTVPQSSSDLMKTIVASTLSIYGGDGSVTRESIEWAHPKPASETLLQKYFSAKYWFSPVLSVFSVSEWVYSAFLIFFAAALLLSIAVEFRKQHPHVVFRTIGFLWLIFFLWRF